ncbi:MAG: glycosyltransferase family 4 protein [bacterium]|nr:glycosyltransferase family 4 protein [bacterium]
MHIVCLYQHYCNPDCATGARAYAILRHLARRHQVTLITSRACYDARLTQAFDWVPPGVRLHMLDVPYNNQMNARRRLRAYTAFALKALAQGLRAVQPTLVYGISTPLTTGWAAAQTARLRHVPWVFEIRDVWPDFPIQMGAVPSVWMQNRLYRLERALYRSAAQVITVSPDMTDHVRRQGIPHDKVTTLLQGTDFDLLDACHRDEVEAIRQRHGLSGCRVILYAGTFGRANDIPTLLQAAERLAHRNDLRFVFLGQGFFTPTIEAAARRLPNVLAPTPQARHHTLAWFKLADLSLVSFIDLPVLATNAPTKFFDSLGAGTPVLVTNPGWTKRFVEEHRCGWYAPPSDADALAHHLDAALADPEALAEAGCRAAAVARQQFDRDTIAGQLEAIFERVAGQEGI